ncbi:MAG TPA: RnfABCDGE type electron transport complex subunit D [Rhodocyclaceae bacterium]
MDVSTLRLAKPEPAPHAHGGGTVGAIMRRVCIALVPATIYGFWLYGWPAINLFCVTVGSAVLAEIFCLRLMRRASRLADGSAVLTGWLLALSLPPWAPAWIGIVGGFVAIAIGKQLFGGLGFNPFNPAMVARVFLLVSFPVVMTQWVAPLPISDPAAPGIVEGIRQSWQGTPPPDAVTSATLLGHVKTEFSRGVAPADAVSGAAATLQSWTGMRAGSLGETAALLLVAGGLYLLALRIISWHIPLAVLAGIGVPALIAHWFDPARFLAAEVHLLSGAAVLGAFFIATDYVTSPNTRSGQLVYGASIGLLTWLIRSFGGYPEGIAFAILLMNAMTPLIDRTIRPRIVGRTRSGAPISVRAAAAKSGESR